MPAQTDPPSAAMTDAEAEKAAHQIITDFATSYRDDTPNPTVGSTPPVAQPGRPAMSQQATDASVIMLAGGATTVMVGGTAATLMYVSQFADPIVCALVFGAPAAIALAVSRLFRNAKQVGGDTHHHYSGTVHQNSQTIHSQSSWLGKTTNNL
ncbi:hypothetical protein [Streptomyces sp. NPDC096030]|uniref:hypothetical protein n=1 Tax=Streptomyces sp. NPDC096030 TaxID=3155423 RepID=UPI00331664BF